MKGHRVAALGLIVLVGGASFFGCSMSAGDTRTDEMEGASSATDESRDELAGPGGCSKLELRTLQAAVTAACKSGIAFSCRPGMDRARLQGNAALASACAAARNTINNRCFGGGDAGHREAARNAERAAQKCRDFLR